ncbi:hypothetical protein CCMA1212_000427 [Trichoderma ghanense]|uniref:DUF2293 domain-containing protein n=1 Tax=Trichoderma ghanense TaxID=65468 RepID=A0ABY2HII3_9HYPO
MNREPTVTPDTPMPKGYGFLRKGNPFMTALCRRKAHEARKTLYVVSSRGKQQGLRAPKWILHQVFSEEKASRERRRGAVERRDAATQDAFEAAILRTFPRIPKQDLATILKRTLRKRSGRVGRTGTLDLDKKAYLAVQAHVRHCHTDYDRLTETRDREAARRAIRDKVSELLVEWGGKPAASKTEDNRDSINDKRENREIRAPREAMARTAQRLVARTSSVSKLKQPPKQIRPSRIGKLGKPQPQPQPVVIDLTQDDEDGSEEIASASRASSEDEHRDSSGQEGDDDSYELSDAVGSDGDYELDSDWLSD